ncbi:uncharacterized protein TRIADDRAFT_54522 [Trichoplax adhaerens]|uniref:DZF domain-containing protein n=1 Tax=Trichoplax adhaerens TaxID=10228 RepID=B3RS99_TRIAD|nr:hypothetical protein TRIADDRAFT_54522 [Trichoplax adhaerens]EDV27018.1 hypothetical protein TRIADDRAFT_54522 [Trichoplax adhaerens]|eukprot:XP_002111014.1 hypothetical protein TRIADDRAFT_54522 [Trichoplax adhaerens]
MYSHQSGHRPISYGTSINSAATRSSMGSYHSGHESTTVGNRTMHHPQAMDNEMGRIGGGHQHYDESNYYEPPNMLHSGDSSHYDYDLPVNMSSHHHRQQYHPSQLQHRQSQYSSYQSMPSSYGGQRSTPGMNRSRRGNIQSSYISNRNKVQKPPSKPIYCEICRISCMSEQTYKEHTDGQKHKKREQQSAKATSEKGIKCELCDIVCLTGESYDAHINGSKHQKVVRLHKQLGKPIPDAPSPETIARIKSEILAQKKTTDQNLDNKEEINVSEENDNITSGPSTTLSNVVSNDTSTNANVQPASPNSRPVHLNSSFNSAERDVASQKSIASDKTSIVTPSSNIIGEEYCVLTPDNNIKVPRFECKICHCSFNQADRHSHLSGKRHKATYYHIKGYENESNHEKTPLSGKIERKEMEDLRNDGYYPSPTKKRQKVLSDAESEPKIVPGINDRPPSLMSIYVSHNKKKNTSSKSHKGASYFIRGTPIVETIEDRLVMKKHDIIFPNQSEIKTMQDIIMIIESTLKDISDVMIKTETNIGAVEETTVVNTLRSDDEQTNIDVATAGNSADVNNKTATPTEPNQLSSDIRLLQDIRRIGTIAKGLMLNGDKQAELVVLCAEEPTVSLLQGVETNIKERLAGDNYETKCDTEEGIITISHDHNEEVKIYLTSATMESQDDSDNYSIGVVDRKACLNALMELRRFEWFKPMEVLIHNTINSSDVGLGPAKAFRRLLEVIASGILLPDGPGVKDPCEKEPCNAFGYLDIQTAEDITSSAQCMLRQVVFRQLHKILDVEPIAPQKKGQARNEKRKLKGVNKVQDNIPGKRSRLENSETPIDREIVESM